MSSRYYNEIFRVARRDLKSLVIQDTIVEPVFPIMEKDIAFERVACRYLSYVKISKQLNECYDHIIHPQKICIIRELLEGCICRALELKEELVQIEFRDFHFLDNFLSRFQMTPSDMDLPIPSYLREEKSDEQIENEIWLRNAFDQLAEKAQEQENKERDISEAVEIIQIYEKARQDKNFFFFLKEKKRMEEEEKRKFGEKKMKPNISEYAAAIKIQKIWRGCKARRASDIDREKEMCLLGMLQPATYDGSFAASIDEQVKKHRKKLQKELEEDYLKVMKDTKEYIEEEVAPKMAEKMEDKIRDYLHSYNMENAKFPVFPTDEEGGSNLFFSPQPIVAQTPVKDKGKKEKEKKKEKDKKKKKEEEVGFRFKPTNIVPIIKENLDKYDVLFKKVFEKDKKIFEFDVEKSDPLNLKQIHEDKCDKSIVKKELLKSTKEIVHLQIDAHMRKELEVLEEAFAKDIGKKVKKKKKKGGKKGKGKKGKGKKGKKEKDLTPDRTFESLIEELIDQNILKEYPKVYFDDIVGSYCYSGSLTQKKFDVDPDPSIGDVKRVLKESCVLPMVSAEIHSKSPFAKSLLIAGPAGCGKTTFVHAICTEIGATLFDLTAENIAEKYPGKPGLNMLMHLVSKVGKRLQPSVIYIKDAEKTFMKKVPKTDLTDPKRLKKDLPKFVKGINADNRLMLVGTTCLPFNVDLKGLGKTYLKVIYLGKPGYGCRRALWYNYIQKNGGIITPKLDMSTLTQISDGYTPLHIKSIVEKVLTSHRVESMEKFPLILTEFSSLLPLYTPVYDEEHNGYKAWMLKMPLGKKRNKMLKGLKEGDDGKKKKGDKKKK